ncbi:MAG: hypothetical protein FWG38_11720 [Defluviitaleaceae bacterium]|nr:hypothetical protein [Defluviitaleaceae bacterium]
MDINCTHDCFYQQDGKCTLQTLPAGRATNDGLADIDCLYYCANEPTVLGRYLSLQ